MLPQADFDKANKLLVDMDWEQLLDTPGPKLYKTGKAPVWLSWITERTLLRCNNFPWLSKHLKQDYMYIEKLQTVILCNSGSKKQFWNTVKYLMERAINS